MNIYKDELKVKDYNIYRSYYCGLCKKLGEEFSIRARLSLNYDFAFLALVLSSLSDGKEEIKYENCFIHPLTKRPVLKSDDYLTYSAYMSIIVTYFKLKDDVSDNKNIKSFFAYLFFKGYFKKAKKKYPKKCEIIKTILEELNIKEKENCADIDEVSDCFGRLLSEVFLKDGEDRALKEFSYQLGRFIYIIDALDDIEKDIKSKNYNPFIKKYSYNNEDAKEFKKRVCSEYDLIVTLTLESIASAFELIDFKKNKTILQNIVYLGLRKAKDKVKGE
ncbi:MAG: hypothetical protein E7419_03260 [Ruminococcaceae bacterium]|nr:hypothetical protein [Oscillospiraceae bacterium]